jgi:hypothetical protein
MFLLREITAADLANALDDGLADNLSAADCARMKPRADALKAIMNKVGVAKVKSVIALDYVPEVGTRVSLDGVSLGAPVPGADFYAALLSIWIGDKPVDPKLKAAMLGQA